MQKYVATVIFFCHFKKLQFIRKCEFFFFKYFYSGGADDIDVNSIRIMQENLTYGALNFKWDEPKDYNGLIVNYYVEIKSSDVSIFIFNNSLYVNWIVEIINADLWSPHGDKIFCFDEFCNNLTKIVFKVFFFMLWQN